MSTDHDLFEEKGEPKRYRTEVFPFTSLTARPNRLNYYYYIIIIVDPFYIVERYWQGPRSQDEGGGERVEGELCLTLHCDHLNDFCDALLQTPECSEYHPSAQSLLISGAFSLTRLQLPGTISMFLSVMLLLPVLSNLPSKLSSFHKPSPPPLPPVPLP